MPACIPDSCLKFALLIKSIYFQDVNVPSAELLQGCLLLRCSVACFMCLATMQAILGAMML